jgi:hypothetical protein
MLIVLEGTKESSPVAIKVHFIMKHTELANEPWQLLSIKQRWVQITGWSLGDSRARDGFLKGIASLC